MLENTKLSRLFGGCSNFEFGGGYILPLIVILLLFSLGDDLFDFLFCEDSAIIWIILIVMLLFFVQDDCCC